MSNTPETDAAAFDAFDGQGGDEVVFANLARRFERERNKAEAGWLECRNFAQQMVDERDRYKSEVEVITRERDEALNKAHNYEQGYLTHATRADTLEKERDEARKALQSVMDWNAKCGWWERPETVARFEADMARAREVLEETE